MKYVRKGKYEQIEKLTLRLIDKRRHWEREAKNQNDEEANKWTNGQTKRTTDDMKSKEAQNWFKVIVIAGK